MKKVILFLAVLVIAMFASASFASLSWTDYTEFNIISSSDTGITFNGEQGGTAYAVSSDKITVLDGMVMSFDISGISANNNTVLSILLTDFDTDSDNCYNLGTFKNGHYSFDITTTPSVRVNMANQINAGDVFNEIGFYPNYTGGANWEKLPVSAYADANAGITISNMKFAVAQTAIPEPMSITYGAIGLLSVLGLKKKLGR